MSKILVTGAFGQIGTELTPTLQKKYGKENVVALGHKNIPEKFDGVVERADINDENKLKGLVEKYDITEIYHLVSLLSVGGEANPDLCWQVNMGGLKKILDLVRHNELRLFWPSSIAAFGPTTPKDAPQSTILEPTTIYGVTKVSGELLCQYYFLKYGVDVRSVRYPGIVSWKTPPSQGTSEYSIAMFYEGLNKGKYECFLGEETRIPMMYVNDAVKATLEIMDADQSQIKIRTSYNVSALSFSAKELEEEIKKHIPLEVAYKPDERQKIADSWPNSLDDKEARSDWGWKPDFELPQL
ncbi:MAG: NAD-dependent epimerase/dehydratase family protein, partial [bacterium]